MGTFIPAIGRRMAYDVDGTQGFWFRDGLSTVNILNNTQMALWNNESPDTAFNLSTGSYNNWVGFIFPELRDLEGYYNNTFANLAQTLQTSTDTTSGFDGTWVTRQVTPQWDSNSSDNGYYRKRAAGLAVSGIKALRYLTGNSTCIMQTFHLYGTFAVGQNLDRMRMWDPVLDQELLPNDLDPGNGGDVTQGQTYNKTFRVKNNSSTKTATNTVVSMEILTDVTPSVPAQYSMSYGGSPYAPNITIPSLAPGAISGVIDLRYNVSPTAVNLVSSPRIAVVPQTYA